MHKKDNGEIGFNHRYKHKTREDKNTKNVEKETKSTSGEIQNETAFEYLIKRMYAEVTKKSMVNRFDE